MTIAMVLAQPDPAGLARLISWVIDVRDQLVLTTRHAVDPEDQRMGRLVHLVLVEGVGGAVPDLDRQSYLRR